MKNRSANRENTYSNLAAWCEKYHEESGIKVHPSSVPVDLVLEDIMGIVAHLRSNINMLIGSVDNAFNVIDEIKYKIEQVEKAVEAVKETRKVKK